MGVSAVKPLMPSGGLLQVFGSPKGTGVCVCLLILFLFCGLANPSSLTKWAAVQCQVFATCVQHLWGRRVLGHGHLLEGGTAFCLVQY